MVANDEGTCWLRRSITLAPLLIILALLSIDFVPRFYQGDSLVYVQANWQTGLPSERSWTFGLIVNFLLRHTNGYSSFILIQATIFAAIVAASQRFFRAVDPWRVAFGLTAVALSLDPLLEIYLRFYMTDSMALACIFVCLLGIMTAIDPDARPGAIILGLASFAIGAVAATFLRIAAIPVLELTALFVAALCWRRLRGRGRIGLVLMLCIPLLAAGALATANALVFPRQSSHALFLVKLSGINLAGNYAPAIEIGDFEAAGIPITEEEFRNLDLDNYPMRWTQVWSPSDHRLASFLGRKLNTSFSSDAVDAAAKRLVMHALRRSPQSFARIYLRTWWDYVRPAQWQSAVREEMGLKPLPDSFVAYFNAYSITRLTPEISEFKSPIVTLVAASLWFYPLLLGLGLCAAIVLLLRDGTRPAVAVLSAGLLADLVAVPLYSLSVVPRFLLPAIFISYLLIGLAGLRSFSRTPQPDQEAQP